MGLDVVQFVDQIGSSPTVRLNLNDESPWAVTGVDFSPPALKQAWSGTLLADGERLTAAAYANRRLRLSLELITASQDAAASALQDLWQELNRSTNVLRYQPDGATNPVFFRTIRSSDTSVRDYPGGGPSALRTVEVDVAAEPFAYGLKETLSQVTVGNDPNDSTDLNSNPYFETDVSGWTGTGAGVARSTAQAHEGSASLLLTPDGVTASVDVRSDYVPVTAGLQYRASAWLRSTVARSVSTNINWYNGTTYLSTSSSSAAYAATTWTLADLTATAPPSATQARFFAAAMTGTPPAGNSVYVDEARFRQVSGSQGGMFLDVTSPLGDVETPLFLQVRAVDVTTPPAGWGPATGRRQSVFAVRRRGTPSAAPAAIGVESMTLTTDTTLQSVSGAHGGQVGRVSFTTTTALQSRMFATVPSVASTDARGTYRTFVRLRKNTGSDVMQVMAHYVVDSTAVYGDITTVPGTTTGWRWVDLGLVQIPLGYDPVTDGLSGAPVSVQGLTVYLSAARTSGAGTLDVDTIMLMPADDRYCEVRWPEYGSQTYYVLDSAAPAVYATGAAGEVRSTVPAMEGLPPMVSPGATNRIWLLRDVGSDYSGGDDAAGYVRVTPYYWPRYLTVRGS